MKHPVLLLALLTWIPLAFAQGEVLLAEKTQVEQSPAQQSPARKPQTQKSLPHDGEQASGEKPVTKIYRYTSKDGVISFSDRAPRGTPYRVVSYSCYACSLTSRVDWHNTPLQLTLYENAIQAATQKYPVDPALVRAVIHAESAFRSDAISRKGAMGLMQLMPDTASDMGVNDVMSPAQNIQGGVRYLAWLLKQHNGNVTLATAAYNAGPGAVKRHKGIPPYAETQTYVRRVKILHERYRKELANQTIASATPI